MADIALTSNWSAPATVRRPDWLGTVAHRVEVYTQPHVGQEFGYKSCVHYAKGSDIPLVLGGKSVGSLPVSEFLA